MKSKKKLVIALTSMIAVFAISIVAVVAIFAAQNQSVESRFRVRYTAVDVSATVRANYIVGNVITPMLTDDGEEELVFLPTSSEGGALTPQDDDIELDTIDNSIVFEYIFTNDSSTIDVVIDLDTTGFSINNMGVSYAYSYSRIHDVANMPTTESFEPMMILGEAKEKGDFKILYVYVKAKVTNIANDASFEGIMDFSLTRGTPVKLSFSDFDNYSGIMLNDVLLQPRIVPANVNIYSLPEPDFGDGVTYVWTYDNGYTNYVRYPFTLNEDTTLFWSGTPYKVTRLDDGTTIIDNDIYEPLYIETKRGATFTYGGSEYVNTDGSYLLLEPSERLVVSNQSGANNVNYASPVSMSKQVMNIYIGDYNKPSDFDEKLFYAAYGEYPQTYVGNKLNGELKRATLTPTGKSYTTDFDIISTTLVEYSYGGKKYAKLDRSYLCGNNPSFSNGEQIEGDQIYFFYVEPIVTKAMQKNNDGTYSVMTLNILGSRAFNYWGNEEGNGVFDNSWQNSDIRAYLNNSFLNESGLGSIVVEQSITNTDYYGTSPVSGNTNDKIWIASIEEILNWTGSGDRLNDFVYDEGLYDENDDIRKMKATDMAYATYGSNYYYTRTASVYEDSVCNVSLSGSVHVPPMGSYYSPDYGFCPVFAVNV